MFINIYDKKPVFNVTVSFKIYLFEIYLTITFPGVGLSTSKFKP